MKAARRALGVLLVLVAAASAGALAYAPYLPQLLIEGFPPLVRPERGHFAVVDGAAELRNLATAASARTKPLLAEFDAFFNQSGGKALLVFKDGALALEHYGQGISPQTMLNSYSMAKSLIGALIYRALADGRLESLDTLLGTVLPQVSGAALGQVTIRALLTMRSGIAFDTGEAKFGGRGLKDIETAPDPFGPLARLHFLGLGAIESGLTLSEVQPASFNYQNVNTALLGAVLEVLYQRPLPVLLAETIWKPAGAEPARWRQPGAGMAVSAYCCIYATARDWVRVGLFLSENGAAEAPFLPEALWREFLGLDLDYETIRRGNYGQHLIQDVLDRPGQALQGAFSYMSGQGGQLLYLMPDKGLVVYRAGERVPLLHTTLYGAWNSADAEP